MALATYLERSLPIVRRQAIQSTPRIGWFPLAYIRIFDGLEQYLPMRTVATYRRTFESGADLDQLLDDLDAMDNSERELQPLLDAARFIALERAATDDQGWERVAEALQQFGRDRLDAIASLGAEYVTYSLGRAALVSGDWSDGLRWFSEDKLETPDHQRYARLALGVGRLADEPARAVNACLETLSDHHGRDGMEWALLCRHGALLTAEPALVDRSWACCLRMIGLSLSQTSRDFGHDLFTIGRTLALSGDFDDATAFIDQAVERLPVIARKRLKYTSSMISRELHGDHAVDLEIRAFFEQAAAKHLA